LDEVQRGEKGGEDKPDAVDHHDPGGVLVRKPMSFRRKKQCMKGAAAGVYKSINSKEP